MSAECSTLMLREGDWELFQDCSNDQVCVFSGGAALCHTCTEGCDEGHCLEPQCESGACCEDGHFASSTTRCRETPEATECRCTSGECGADVECRSQHRYCTGLSAECTRNHLEWEDWAVTESCSTDQVCEVSGGSGECLDCELGCELGECIEAECSRAPAAMALFSSPRATCARRRPRCGATARPAEPTPRSER